MWVLVVSLDVLLDGMACRGNTQETPACLHVYMSTRSCTASIQYNHIGTMCGEVAFSPNGDGESEVELCFILRDAVQCATRNGLGMNTVS